MKRLARRALIGVGGLLALLVLALATIRGCVDCHTATLGGQLILDEPPVGRVFASNLTPDPRTGLGGWTERDFFAALRTGRRPDGSDLRPEMPWKLTAELTDDEIRALWLYLRTVPAKAAGQR